MGGRIQLKDSYVSVRDGEIWVLNAHISPYLRTATVKITTRSERVNYCFINAKSPSSERETTVKGMTLVVTRIYLKNGRIKFEIGVAKGKKLYDKREKPK